MIGSLFCSEIAKIGDRMSGHKVRVVVSLTVRKCNIAIKTMLLKARSLGKNTSRPKIP